MRCDWVEFRLLLHAHDELGGWERWRINRHLRHCPDCREQHEQFGHERRVLGSCLRIATGARIADRIALQLGVRRPVAGPRIVVSRRLPLLLLALVAVSSAGAGVAYVGWKESGDPFRVWRRSIEQGCPPQPATPIVLPASGLACPKQLVPCPPVIGAAAHQARPTTRPSPARRPGKTASR